MVLNEKRIGNFTSSEIVALTTKGKQAEGFGVPAITYINEKRIERLLGRSIDNEATARPLTWGKTLESRVFEFLGIDYTMTSLETDLHPTISCWAGSKDGTRESGERAIFDIKCPMTLKSFCGLVMPLYCGYEGNEAMSAIRSGFNHNGVDYEKHKDGEKYYWQLVSNAIINNVDWAELIIHVPYFSELDIVRTLAESNPDAKWIMYSADCELPYLIDNGNFKNVNVIRFKIPKEDKDFLTTQVIKAESLL